MAPSTQKKFDKPKLSETGLRKCGIFFDPEVFRVDDEDFDPLPPMVDDAREALLLFDSIIHPGWKKRMVPPGSPKPPPTAWLNKELVSEAVNATEEARVEAIRKSTCRSIAVSKDFQALANSEERGWTQAMVKEIFQPFTGTEISTEYVPTSSHET
jgi:hypothetical protein